MTVKYQETDPEEDDFWPRVGIYADNCRVKSVNFVSCLVDIASKGNVVEHCNFFGCSKPSKFIYPFDAAIYLKYCSCGNIIRNIFIQNQRSGVCIERYSSTRNVSSGNHIENVTCRNVWRVSK
jgi:hypothetical protein